MNEDRDDEESRPVTAAANETPVREADPPSQDGGQENSSSSDEGADDAGRKKGDRVSKHPATDRQKVWVFVFLLLTMPLLWAGGCALRGYQDGLNREVCTSWKPPKGVVLKPGPITFRYEPEKNELFYRGPMSEREKKDLLSLIEPGSQSRPPKEAANSNKSTTANRVRPPAVSQGRVSNSNKSTTANGEKPPGVKTDDVSDASAEADAESPTQSFEFAIGDLAYRATRQNDLLPTLMLLAGLAGAVGAQLRSASSFVYACKKDYLDVRLYWPWYLLRPLIGFVVGVIVVVLVKGGLFMASDSSATTQVDMWWLGLAIIVGFGSEGFTDKLYLIGKTIFGEGPKETETNKNKSDKEAEENKRTKGPKNNKAGKKAEKDKASPAKTEAEALK